jgi:hypothetical protein
MRASCSALIAVLSLLSSGCRTPAHVVLEVPKRHVALVTWTRLEGPLWLEGGPKPADVFQGSLNDCALLGHLVGLAARQPEVISRMIESKPDGTFVVTLHRKGTTPVQVPVDRMFPASEGRLVYAGEAQSAFWSVDARKPAAQNTLPIWPMVIEKAMAIEHGGYQVIDRELPKLEQELGGRQSTGIRIAKLELERRLAIVQEAVAGGLVVVLGNSSRQAAELASVRPLHAYVVLEIRTSPEGAVRFLLRNPTGEVRAPRVQSKEGPGTFEMDAAEAMKTFRYVGIAGPSLSALKTIPAD